MNVVVAALGSAGDVHLTGFPLYDEDDSRPPQDGLTEFLDAGDAPVVFTAGSMLETACLLIEQMRGETRGR